jgi:hypothetical protein
MVDEWKVEFLAGAGREELLNAKRVESALENIDWNRSIPIKHFDLMQESETIKPVGSD